MSSNRFEKYPKLTLFGSLLIGLLCIEGILQIFFLHKKDFTPQSPYRETPLTHHDVPPNFQYTSYPMKYDIFKPFLITTNSLGIRGPEIGPKKFHRVINLGDSMIQAEAVPFEETFGYKLNRHFANKIEFISHGISSWSPTTEFSWLYNIGLNLQPDEVNLFLCINDFYRSEAYTRTDATYRQLAYYENNIPVRYRLTNWDLKPQTKTQFIKLWIFKHVELVRLFHPYYTDFKQKISKTVGEKPPLGAVDETILLAAPATTWPTGLKKNVDETLKVVVQINQFLKAHSIHLNVLMVPYMLAWKNESPYGKIGFGFAPDSVVSQKGIEDYIQSTLKSVGIPYIDLRKNFERSKQKNPGLKLFSEHESHWNANGHQVVFETLKTKYK